MPIRFAHKLATCATCGDEFMRRWPKNTRCPACVKKDPYWGQRIFKAKKRAKEQLTAC